MTVAPVPPVPRSTGVTVWDRKKPERHPEKEVKLPSGLSMPAAEDLDSSVDLEDWIREAERQIDDDAEGTRIFLVPMATALTTGASWGWSGGSRRPVGAGLCLASCWRSRPRWNHCSAPTRIATAIGVWMQMKTWRFMTTALRTGTL